MATGAKSSSSAERRSRNAGSVGTRKEISRAGYSAKNVLHLFEERLFGSLARARLDRFLRHGRRQLLEQALLIAGEFFRHGDARDDVEIAVAAARHVRHALAAQLEPRARLRAGRD